MNRNTSIRINFNIKRTILLMGFLFIGIISCEKEGNDLNRQYIAKIVGFDLNCSTCILSFPNDSLIVKNLFGESKNNYYQTTNLAKHEFKIGQMIKVRVRKEEENELEACITLYASYNYENIYVSEYEHYKDFAFNDTI